ncbi:thymic stromal cotransporter protein isoform X3 [Erpetoichthys calabaricus]|uniref:Solute carrier family 46 member 2 n=1 Tax=Erpetoichthys calabaricus TaxID=27687 RepID=A0A8C4S1P9_ERPCA|nr:thymic stromal cotransporter protein isoform X3 [Erpetoichthys calabaricus]
MCRRLRTFLQPVVMFAQVGSTIYETGLLMLLKERYNSTANSSFSNASHSEEDEQQKAISNFYMISNIILGVSPVLTALCLARLGDKGYRKLQVCLPLVGYLLSRVMLLLVILFEWPVQVMFGAVILQGLSGSYCAYWAGVMAITADQSTEKLRAVQMESVQVAYGVAGLIGSMTSGYIYNLDANRQHPGVILAVLSSTFTLLSLIYSTFLLKTQSIEKSPSNGLTQENCTINQNSEISDDMGDSVPSIDCKVVGDKDQPAPLNSFQQINIVLLFIAAVLYDTGDGQFMNIRASFVVKEPLNWNVKLIGYGNAANFAIYFTSFLGVCAFHRCLSDAFMVGIGILSFASGLLLMAFVTKTYMYFVARALNLFALMTMPTIRSMLSKQVDASSYGKIFVLLELSFTLASVITSPIFTKIYQATLDWFAGFCFILSSILSFLAIIPVGVVAYRTRQQQGYEPIPSS